MSTLKTHQNKSRRRIYFSCILSFVLCSSCAQVDVPGARGLDIPSPTVANQRQKAVNERPDSVMYLPLGADVLVPESDQGDPLPNEMVGPFELRSENLAGALQLILSDYEIPLAFQTNEGLTRTITVSNLRGPLNDVVNKVCGLADLYCAYEGGVLVIKETQTFTVSIPPIGGENDILSTLTSGLTAITGQEAVTESSTRTIIYEATNRTAQMAERFFQRLRANTALIVFEVFIWEVSLNTDNATGINWEQIDSFGKFSSGISLPGGAGAAFGTPISIGLPTTGDFAFDGTDVLEFISNYGAVKTISQPQITVLSGAEATLRAADTINYVSSLTRTSDDGDVTVSTETDSVDTGFTLTISSNWDNATIYGNIDIELQEFREFTTFGEGTETEIQLPSTTERELSTQIRIRPGDSLLIAGLVRESDQYDKSGPGFNSPIIPLSQGGAKTNTELVFLLKPRVIIYTPQNGSAPSNPTESAISDSMASEAAVPMVSQPIVKIKQQPIMPEPSLQPEGSFPDSTFSGDQLNPALSR